MSPQPATRAARSKPPSDQNLRAANVHAERRAVYSQISPPTLLPDHQAAHDHEIAVRPPGPAPFSFFSSPDHGLVYT